MRTSLFAPLDQNAVIVRITSYDQKRPRGVMMSPGLEKPLPFQSLSQLLLSMEALMDRKNQPQRGEERRAFGEYRPPKEEGPGPGEGRELANFQIRVLFRQNASWQGNLVWIDRQMDAQFRSVLELVRLMDSALSSGEEDEAS